MRTSTFSRELPRYEFAWAAALVLLSFCLSASAITPSFQGLGANSLVYDVSNAGTAVGRNGGGAAVWRPGIGWTNLGFTGFAYKSSAHGTVAAGFVGESQSTIDGNIAYRWTSTAGVSQLGDIPGGGTGSQALGLSADGNVVVGAGMSPVSNREAFRWTAATGLTSLGPALGNPYESIGKGASSDGSVVAGDLAATSSSDRKAFIWSQNGSVSLIDGSSVGITAMDCWSMSADGSTIVGNSNLGAYRWNSSTGAKALGKIFADDGSSEARDVTGNGSVVTGFIDLHGTTQTAFIWDSTHGMRDLRQVLQTDYGLNLTGWTLQWAYVSDDGTTFGGAGRDPSGASEAWLAVVPEPSSLCLLIAGLSWRRFKRAGRCRRCEMA